MASRESSVRLIEPVREFETTIAFTCALSGLPRKRREDGSAESISLSAATLLLSAAEEVYLPPIG